MKKYTLRAAAVIAASGLCLSGCSAKEPYGGQCDILVSGGQPSYAAFIAVGSANFDYGISEELQQVVWDAGFQSIADWDSKVLQGRDAFKMLDKSKLSDEEKIEVEAIIESFDGLIQAQVLGDANWYTDMGDRLVSALVRCDG